MSESIVGSEVDGYHIEEIVGRGGMGVVYRAEDVSLSRTVAIKQIDPSLANDEAFLRRFRSEAQALARIDSSYIVSVYALRETEAGLLLVMEYVDGGSVKDLVRQGPMDWHEARPLIRQMLRALEHAHGANIIHRDVKPENVMLTADGTVKVTDFGLAKEHRPDSQETVTQGVYGTLDYMSPEQVQGAADLDPRSDLYSLGVTIYEMLTGELPFAEEANEFSKMRAIVEEELPRPEAVRPDIPDDLADWVMKALEKDPDDRYESARAMREAFEAVGLGERPESVPSGRSAGGSPRNRDIGTWSWGALAGLTLLGMFVAVGGYYIYSSSNIALEEQTPQQDTESDASTVTQLSISSTPSEVEVYRGDERLGTTPLNREMVGETASLRFQKEGYVTSDTTVPLNGKRTTLALTLDERVARRPLSVRTDPPGARVYLGDRMIGRTPLERPVEGEMVELRLNRDGFAAVDTTLRFGTEGGVQLEVDLEQETTPPVATGTVSVSAEPRGTVLIDGEERRAGQPLKLPSGTHTVECRHPEAGRTDTTLSVVAGESQRLTCYFSHRVVVQSDPWANVYIDGENTKKSTPFAERLATGRSIRIGVRIRRESYTVTGGTYRRRVGDRSTSRDFSGGTTRVRLEPSFHPFVHVLDFRLSEQGS